MAGHPADIRRAPIEVFFLNVEDPTHGGKNMRQISTGRVDNALRLAGGAGGVQNVKRMLAVEDLSRAVLADAIGEFVPPMIAAGLHLQSAQRMADPPVHDDVFNGWTRR